MTSAPIALFAYKRASHLERSIRALQAAEGFDQSILTIFSDGPKSEADRLAVEQVRAICRREMPGARLIEQEHNRGLAASIRSGVTELLQTSGRVIVLEDDLVVAPNFLRWMNGALDHYAESERVMQISAHMFDVQTGGKASFLPFVTSWGWATWSRAWSGFDDGVVKGAQRLNDRRTRRRFDIEGSYPYSRILRQQIEGRVSSWAILWNLHVFLQGGLVLYPPWSFVSNVGFDGEATHTKRGKAPADRKWQPDALTDAIFPSAIAESRQVLLDVGHLLRRNAGAIGRLGYLLSDRLSGGFRAE